MAAMRQGSKHKNQKSAPMQAAGGDGMHGENLHMQQAWRD
jgi:hypothetical protein